jgi:SAM-dependent methyltransferase
MSTPYDQVLYPGLPYGQTHPDRLASIGTLYGMEPAPIDRCRVLELGCGTAGNIIPLAAGFPNCEFLGIDAAATAIQTGREEIAALGLSNIRLEAMNIMDAGPELGGFDYVIAHGLYSWVPEPVRDKLLAISKACLNPQGIAYVSYNALPGCRIREMLREMMFFDLRGVAGADSRLDGARDFLRAFAVSQAAAGEARAFLKDEAEGMAEREAAFLYHDELGDVYHPVYFHEFVSHAARFGLQFLSEAAVYDMEPGKIPPEAVSFIHRATGADRILRDQYLDFMKCRRFRQTLLCHADVALATEPQAGRICRLAASSPVEPVSPAPDLRSGAVEEFRGARGSSVKTAHPLSKAVMVILGGLWPQALPFSELAAAAASLIHEPPDPDGLADIMLATYIAGVIELHALPPRCVSKVSRFPLAGELVRSQARRGVLITTAGHVTIELRDEVARRLIALLDGTRDLPALARELAPVLNQPEGAAARSIGVNLRNLAKMGLLVG